MRREFLDTNILLYAYDRGAATKHVRASELVLGLARRGQATTSIQVLQEFYVNAIRKVARPMTHEEAICRLDAFSRWLVYSPVPGDVAVAAELSRSRRLSFWDAMIVLGASRLGCETLWTEDLNSGQVSEGVTIRNPFVS